MFLIEFLSGKTQLFFTYILKYKQLISDFCHNTNSKEIRHNRHSLSLPSSSPLLSVPSLLWVWLLSPEGPQDSSQHQTSLVHQSAFSSCEPTSASVTSSNFLCINFLYLCPFGTARCYGYHHTCIEWGSQNNLSPEGHAQEKEVIRQYSCSPCPHSLPPLPPILGMMEIILSTRVR